MNPRCWFGLERTHRIVLVCDKFFNFYNPIMDVVLERQPSFGEIDQTELCTFSGVYSIPPRLTVCD